MIPALLALVLAGPAHATRDPTPYRQDLARRVSATAEALNGRGQHAQAVELCAEHARVIGVDAQVAYEEGLAHYALGDEAAAIRAYGRAIEADPAYAPARYDRGELRLSRGDLDAAEEDLLVAARERPDHWAAFFRLAEVAGQRGDPRAFEDHLMEAIRNGWDLRQVVTDADWRAFARDPELGAVLERLAQVYFDVAVYEAMIEG